MKILAVLAAVAAQALPSPPGIPPPEVVASFGIARAPCRSLIFYVTPMTESWVLGYWSGMNAANDGRTNVGAGLNDQGVLALVRAQCVINNDEDVNTAAFQAYEVANSLGE